MEHRHGLRRVTHVPAPLAHVALSARPAARATSAPRRCRAPSSASSRRPAAAVAGARPALGAADARKAGASPSTRATRWSAGSGCNATCAAARDKLSGSIAIFASVTACQSFLPELLGDFRGRYPDVHIRLETGYAADALEQLAEGRVDVSVAAIPPQLPRGLVSRVLLYTPLVFVAPRVACEVERLCHQRPLPWATLPVVLPASGQARESADRWFRRRRIAPQVYGEVPGSEAILALVSLGCGVGIVPRIVVDESPLRASSAFSTPMTAAPRWASSASASAPSARSSRRPSCARCGTRSPP